MNHWYLKPMTHTQLPLLHDITRAAMGPYVQQVYGAWDDALQYQQCALSFTQMPHQCICLEQRHDDIVGVLSVQEENGLHYLRKIYLRPQVQGAGLGTALMQHVIARAAVRGVPLKLRVFHINPAQQLYERLGFETTEIVDEIRRVMVRAPTSV